MVLNPRQKVQLPLVERIELNRNTRIFRFGLPSPEHRIGLPVGKHVFVYASVDGQNVVRAYTPITGDEEKGRLDMLIKVGTCPREQGSCCWETRVRCQCHDARITWAAAACCGISWA